MAAKPNLYDILSELNYIGSNNNNNNNNNNINNDCIKKFETRDNSSTTITDPNGRIINPFPYTLNEFNQFLIRTHCEENLEFFIMTRQFLINDDKRSLRSSNVSSISSKNYSNFDLDLWELQIYNVFIKVDSPKECNLPQYIRELFDDCHNEGTPPRQVFIIQAIQHILGLLLDAYSRFVKYIQQVPAEEWERRKKKLEIETQYEIENISKSLSRTKLSKDRDPVPVHTHSPSSSPSPTPATTTTDQNSSIFLKSRKFFNKFKKTIQI